MKNGNFGSTKGQSGHDDPILKVSNLHKSFGALHVLKGVDMEVRRGQVICLIGSSGSGKSTFLRCLNFMDHPSAGIIQFRGKTIGSESGKLDGVATYRYKESELAQLRTHVGMVFQQFNLFPHMTVMQNVMEGPKTVLKVGRAEATARAEENLRKVGLLEKANEYPSRLSGGQQQRVAIARSLAMKPDVMLFDEITSSLDPELVGEVLGVVRKLAEDGMTMISVTHELGFAYHCANHVMFLHQGKILEEGSPDQVLKNPNAERTKRFLDGFTGFYF
ncbi:amino acid ABC transporter ATP-binding protein [Xanthobacter sp. VNH20]|uniref:amino acid ABC transporter ATP-binding protein n=1 Tax=Xanthobacter sp. VNH20 TaxID=3156616 RepID=UPI0032B61A37